MRLLIRNGTVVSDGVARRADILTEDDKIRLVASSIDAPCDRVIDAAGCYLMPGFIDTHTHLDLPLGAISSSDNFDTGTEAAVLGGTTTVLDFCTQDKGMTMQQAFDTWQRKAAISHCNYGFHLAISEWNPSIAAELPAMVRQGVTSFKMYMVYDTMRLDDGAMMDAFIRMAELGCIAGVHCENYYLLRENIRRLKAAGITGPEGHPLSRPATVEAEGIARLMRILEMAGTPGWVVHISTKEGMEEIRRARARGQKVLAETCPQYLVLDDSCYSEPDAAKYVMSPPLRKKQDQEALLDAMHAGEIDVIGTDHCPFFMKEKAIGKDDFTKIPNGGAGIRNRAELVYTYAVLPGRISLEQMAEQLSTNAARAFGMYPRKGTLRKGADADITIFDPNRARTISWRNNNQHCDNSPYEGFEVAGSVRDVILGGEHVVQGGRLLLRGRGRYVAREKCFEPITPSLPQ